MAIKEMNAGNFRNISQIEQIQEEINVLSNLKHPNIIHLLESTFIGKMVYVIMEYVPGGSLMDFVNSQVGRHQQHRSAFLYFKQSVRHAPSPTGLWTPALGSRYTLCILSPNPGSM